MLTYWERGSGTSQINQGKYLCAGARYVMKLGTSSAIAGDVTLAAMDLAIVLRG